MTRKVITVALNGVTGRMGCCPIPPWRCTSTLDFPLITGLVTATGYPGYIEVEIFSRAAWDAPGR
jgi:hypothetical protein